MKNLNSVFRLKLALFLSGLLFCEPAASSALKLEVHRDTISRKLSSGVSYGNGCPCATAPVVGGDNKIEKTRKNGGSRESQKKVKNSSRCSEEGGQIFLDSQGNVIQFNQGPLMPEVLDRSNNKKRKKISILPKEDISSSDAMAKKDASEKIKKKRIINGRKADVFSTSGHSKDTRAETQGRSRYKRGMTLTVGHELTSSFSGSILGRTREYGALIPLIGRDKGLAYLDSKVKFYDSKAQEVSAGVVVRRKLGKSMIGGLNLFRDIRNTPEHMYTWYSFGAEMFFKTLSISGNCYFSSKDGYVNEVKKLSLDSEDQRKSRVLLNEKLPADGYDVRTALKINNVVGVYGGIFSFHSPYDKSVELSGYRLGSNISFKLNKRFVFSVSPEFKRDNKQDTFSTSFGFTLPIGRGYDNLLEHVVRDKDIVLLESSNEYPVKGVFLDAGTKRKITEVVEANTKDKIQKADKANGKLYHIKNPEAEITLSDELKNVILVGDADLEVHIPDTKGTRVVPYHITSNGKGIKFGMNGEGDKKLENLLISGLRVDLGDSAKYTMTDVEFRNNEIKSNNERPFQDDENVVVTGSKLVLSGTSGDNGQNGPKSVFYSSKTIGPIKYHIADSTIEMPNIDLSTDEKRKKFAVFDAKDGAKIHASVGGTLSIKTKTTPEKE
ncbi:hypothetical protein NHE_0428 [Neorickettsia helminthoeca str. Oregon]|uniref:Inverse autotransporter beta-domain domain-containing protein n=1 Tax=Neorickettsia helminthoeca str. Oregon TaxID=1286528 RepID=X5H3V0_9RICK|nr:inverse autotransporter beta-barrel domain-containing protein [Neorickettsia helminthoeca]AHX11373.1 hypothetical protein NHE_0428 [Neorickettsia helminthoeca str. Oregon]